MQTTTLKKTAVFFQITAMFLLQLYAVAPLFGKNLPVHAGSIKCSGDHKKCGCSKARIASKACCCFKSGSLVNTEVNLSQDHSDDDNDHGHNSSEQTRPAVSTRSCCPTVNKTTVTAKADLSDCNQEKTAISSDNENAGRAKSIPVISSRSCGGDPESITVSLENLKFIKQKLSFHSLEPTSLVRQIHAETFQNRFLEPPDPPPQNS